MSRQAQAARLGLLHQYRLGTSGSGVYLTSLARHLADLGHELTVLSHDDAAAAALPPGCRTVSLRGAGTPVAYPRAEEPGSPLFRELPDQVLQQYLEHSVDLVTEVVTRAGLEVLHVNSEVPMAYVAAEVKRRCGIPYVVVGHGSTLEYVVGTDPRYLSLCQTGLSEAAAVVALNADVRRRMLDLCPDVAPRLVELPPGVDCTLFRPDRTGPRHAAPTVAYVGRLSVEKGVFHLLGTLGELRRQVPDVQVLVMGAGTGQPLLERMTQALRDGDQAAAERALRAAAHPDEAPWVEVLVDHWHRTAPATWPEVEFTGHLPPAQVAARLAGADVVVVPSLVREAFPLIVLEALACGTPAVCADAGGLAAVLSQVRGHLGAVGDFMTLPGDAAGMTQQLPAAVASMLRHLQESGSRAEATALCRDLATSSYDWPAVARRLSALYSGARDGAPLMAGERSC